MKDRIKDFMEHKGLSAGELADILEVQRSNISHVLNGRNKPGANFIEKLLLNFTDINARWLLTGVGEMTTTQADKVNTSAPSAPSEPDLKPTPAAPAEKPLKKESGTFAGKKIEKIVVLFNDGTFSDYDKHKVATKQ